MNQHYITYSGPMARAKVAGIKTMTRKPLVCALDIASIGTTEQWARGLAGNSCFGRTITEADIQRKADELRGRLHPLIRSNGSMVALQCPYGQPGDALMGREPYWAWGRWEATFNAQKGRDAWRFVDMTRECGLSYLYDADAPPPSLLQRPWRNASSSPAWWKRPANYMPRHAARILDVIVSVRVERLHDISDEDVLAEGLPPCLDCDDRILLHRAGGTHGNPVDYCEFWESTYGAGSWDANPFVWVIATRRL